MKTICDAVKHLPPDVQAFILWQWEAIGYEDIYDGDLRQYLLVINSVWNQLMIKLRFATATMISIHALTLAAGTVTRAAASTSVFYLPEHL